MKKSFAQILDDAAASKATKIASKLPHWVGEALEYPDTLCLEQCSGEEAAIHKAEMIPPSQRIADLTGGLGVDSWAFSRKSEAVFYNERNLALGEAVRRNFERLGAGNVEFHNFDIDPGKEDWKEALKEFAPDWIYMDPARRDAVGRKVFRPEDCQPDIQALFPTLATICPNIMVKLSPMADLSMICGMFEGHLHRLQIVETGSEVKELLCFLDSGKTVQEPLLEIISGGKEELSFRRSEEEEAVPRYAEDIRGVLFEPRSALSKSGAFRLCCERFGLGKIAPSTHLYVGDDCTGMEGLFKKYRILEVVDFGKKEFTVIGKRFPHADVSARNLPVSSEELRSRMKITPGHNDGIHIFGCAGMNGKSLIVTKKFVNTK